MWDQLLDDKAVRRWLSPARGVVLCIGAESLSGHGDDTAAFMRQRLLTVRNRSRQRARVPSRHRA